MTRQEELDILLTEMKRCTECRLRETCFQVVPGEGSVAARIVFLAEGPGETEDTEGRPLVGRSGQFFRQTLRQSRIEEDYPIFISNAVRCRPPDNRDPNTDEKEACWPWTLKTLRIIRPKVIVPMGWHALEILGTKLGFANKVGQQGIKKKAGIPIYVAERNLYIYPLIHPAYALRQSEMRVAFAHYFMYLKKALPGWLTRAAPRLK